MHVDPYQSASALKVSRSAESPDYWRNLVAQLMKMIPPMPLETTLKSNKLADKVGSSMQP